VSAGDTRVDALDWRALARALSFSSAGSLAALAAGALRAALISHALGAAGFGLFAQIQGLALAARLLAAFASGGGLTRLLSEADARAEPDEAERVLPTALLLLAVPATLACLGAWLWAEPLAVLVFADGQRADWVRWVAPSLPVAGLCGLLLGVLRSGRQVARLALLEALLGMASVIYVLALRADGLAALARLPLLIEVTRALGLVCLAREGLRAGLRGLREARPWRGPVARELLRYGAASVALALIAESAPLVVGRAFLAAGAAAPNGAIHAARLLSGIVLAVQLAAYQGYLFPTFCRTAPGPASTRALERALLAFVLFALPAFGLLALMAPWLVSHVFGQALAGATLVAPWQCLGDFCRAAGALLGLPLLARGRLAPLVAVQAVWLLVLGATVPALAPALGATGYGGLYAVCGLCALLGQGAVSARFGTPLSRRGWSLLGLACGLLGLATLR
jgi:O-antigen/teichoic acid export membrane protein